jgi:hypothetical protein
LPAAGVPAQFLREDRRLLLRTPRLLEAGAARELQCLPCMQLRFTRGEGKGRGALFAPDEADEEPTLVEPACTMADLVEADRATRRIMADTRIASTAR